MMAVLDLKLTDREEQVCDAIAEGLNDKQIASRLGLSWFTVRSHIRNIRAKSGSANRAQIVAKWLRSTGGARR